MPTRLIREGLLSSDAVARVGELAEVLFVRLMLVADDFGRFDGRVSVICRACWPIGLTTDPDPREVSKRLDLLVNENLIVRYEIDGKPFIHIQKFKQRTRANKSKFPEPPPNARQVPVTRQTDAGQKTDKGQANAGHMTAEAEAYSETDSDAYSSSYAERAREPMEELSTTPNPHKLPTELPSQFLHRITGRGHPPAFDEDAA